jgi:hypothetical protein
MQFQGFVRVRQTICLGHERIGGMCAASPLLPKANIHHGKPQSRYAYAALVLLGRADSFGFGMGQHDR